MNSNRTSSSTWRRRASVSLPLDRARWNQRLERWNDWLLRQVTPGRLGSFPPLLRCGLAVVIAAAATALRWALIPWMGVIVPYNVALVAVVLTTMLLGIGPGLLSTLLGDIGVEVFVLGSLSAMRDPTAPLRFGTSLAIGAFICWLLHALRVAHLTARQGEMRSVAFAAATFEGIVESEGGRIVDCNEQYARIAGRSVAELKGMAIADLIVPEDRERVLANIQANREAVVEHSMLRGDGTRLIVETHGRPVAPGSSRRHTALRDLTEHRRAEKLLNEGETRFQTLANAMPQLAWVARPDGYIHWYNRRWYEYTGTMPAQMEGWGWQSVHDPRVLPQVLDQWKASIASGKPFDMVFPLRGADGRFRSFLTRVEPLKDRQGRVLQWFGTNTDVEELQRVEAALRESERLYRAIGESIDYGIWVCDARGRNTYASESLLKLVGITQEQCADFGWGDVLHPDDREATIAAWKECVKTAGPWYREHRYRGVDGQYHPILACGVPVRNDRGELTAWAGINLDISRLKKAEAAVQASRQMLETVVNHLPAGVSLIRGSDLRLQLVNPAYQALAPGKAMVGKTLDELWPETGRSFASLCRRVLETGEPHEVADELNTIRRRPDGPEEAACLSWSLHRVRLPGDEGWAILSTAWETTQRKQAEEAMRRSEERFRIIASSTPDHVLVQDRELRYTFVLNPQLGLSERDMLGKTDADILAPEDAEKLTAIKRRVLETGEPIRLEAPLISHDGGIEYFDGTYVPRFDAQGRVDGLMGYFRNVTERKRAEAALRESEEHRKVAEAVQAERQRLFAVLETLPAMICLLTPDYHVAFANRSFRERFGESKGRHCYEYCFGREAPCEFCQTFDVFKTGRAHHWEVTGPDGSVIAAHDFPFTDADGTPMILEMDLDITDRKRAEAALQELNSTLEQRVAERTKELRESNEELAHFNRAAVGRELRMIELKKEVNELCVHAGVATRYPLDVEQA